MFRALLLSKPNDEFTCEIVDMPDSDFPETDFSDEAVTIAVEYSTINYKDGLAITGRPGIVRKWPMVPGIDLTGTVLSVGAESGSAESGGTAGDAASGDPAWQPGDRITLNGWDVGESHWGGLAQKAKARPGWLTRLPDAFTTRQAAAVGTAGYTAMLSVLALEEHGITPDKGPIIVTGAAGGVGSVAVAVLAKLGYEVTASSGRVETEGDYLRFLGAAEVIHRDEFSGDLRPLGSAKWAGAIDVVGSTTLVHIISQTQPHGCVAACGLAQGPDLPGSVIPFILRAVTLAGINCVYEPPARRDQAWQRLAEDLDPEKLERMTQEVALADVPQVAADILKGKIRGRVVVDVNA